MSNNPQSEYRHQQPIRNLRRERFGHHVPQIAVPKRRPSAQVWVRVVFALIADGISRGFVWLRIATYLACLGAIWYLGPGAISVYGLKHGLFDLVFGAYIAWSTYRLVRREFTS